LTRNSCISALLIVTLATSVSACIEGAGSSSKTACVTTRRPTCERQLHGVNIRGCSPVLKAVPAHCDLRGLVQFHLAAFAKLEIRNPLRLKTGQLLIPTGPAARNSSTGLPETDRGPPLS